MKLKKKLRILIILAISCLSIPAYSISEQEYLQTRDSLQIALDHSTGQERVDALFEFIRFIVPFEADTCEALIEEEFELAEQLDYEIGMAKACQNRGDYYYHTDRHMLALENYYKAVGIFEASQQFKEAGDTYIRILVIFYFNANPKKFELYMVKAIECYEKCRCWSDLASAHLLYGYYYNNFNRQPGLSKFHHMTALNYYNMAGATPIFIASTYVSMSLAFRPEERDSSIYYLKKSFHYMQGDRDDEKLQRIIAWRDLGSGFYYLKSYDSARYYYDCSVREAGEFNYDFINISNFSSLAAISNKYDRQDEALACYQRALGIALRIKEAGSFYSDPTWYYTSDWMLDSWPGYLKLFSAGARKYWAIVNLPDLYFHISQIYKKKGDLVNALADYEQYHAWSDTLNRINRARELLNMELDRETEIKDRKISDLTRYIQFQELQVKQSRIMLFGALGLVMLGSVILILLFRQSKLKDSHENILLQQKLLRSQINPHFIFNSLSSIQHLVVCDKPELASIYLAEFSALVRGILSTTLSESITYENEIKVIRSYLDLQKLRYSNKFDYSIDTDPMIDTESLTLPSMLAQPFIENAIEHGFRHKEGQGRLCIRFTLDGDKVIFEIEDDGIGRQNAQEIQHSQNKNHQPVSTGLIRERIKVLNRGKKDKITLEIIDLKDENGQARGTLVRFGIPI